MERYCNGHNVMGDANVATAAERQKAYRERLKARRLAEMPKVLELDQEERVIVERMRRLGIVTLVEGWMDSWERAAQ